MSRRAQRAVIRLPGRPRPRPRSFARPPGRRTALAALLVLAALGAGCGGPSADELVEQAFRQPIGSAELTLDVQLEAPEVAQLRRPARLRLSGPYVSGGAERLPQLDLIAVLAAGPRSTAGRLTLTEDNAFVGLEGQSFELGPETIERANRELARGGGAQRPGLRALRLDPRRWLRDAETRGEARVAGVETRHVSGRLDLRRLVEDLAGAGVGGGPTLGEAAPLVLGPAARARLVESVPDPTFDLYAGRDDGRLRRLSTDLAFRGPPQPGALGRLAGGRLALSVELAEVGEPQPIVAPPDPRSAAALRRLVAGVLLELRAGPAGGGGEGEPAPGESGAVDRYARCLERAGDAAGLRRCAELVR